MFYSPLSSIRPGTTDAEQPALPPGSQQNPNHPAGTDNAPDDAPPWMSGGASSEDMDGMTPGQEKDFLDHVEAGTGQNAGKGTSVETPDAGSGYESNTAEDLGNVIELETSDKTQAQTGDYGGQESQQPTENNINNTPAEYTPPVGGGGATERIQIGENTVTLGHGGRHLKDSGLSVDDVNLAIAIDVCKNPPKAGEYFIRMIEIDGFTIEYRVYGTSDSTFNVGTYMIKE